MADCEFVSLDGEWLPAVADVTKTPQYLRDTERTISGNLRASHLDRVARVWRVQLKGVTGTEADAVQQLIQNPAAPRMANVMGEEALVLVTLDEVRHRPRILTGRSLASAGDKARIDVTLTLTELYGGGTWTYEVFTSDGTFNAYVGTVEVLLVGGGGGGRSGDSSSGLLGGGGGAGGVIITSARVTGPVGVVIGAGGAVDGWGGDTRFGTLSARGGAPGSLNVPLIGGSGGGGSSSTAEPVMAGGPGVPGQGHDGGAGGEAITSEQSGRGAGGGGGASQVGGSAFSSGIYGDPVGGPGGNGITLMERGWYAPGAPSQVGGGGGGAGSGSAGGSLLAAPGGAGGGGHGGLSATPAFQPGAGAANTGGGGGGGHDAFIGSNAGAAGGSGLVIVRWQP